MPKTAKATPRTDERLLLQIVVDTAAFFFKMRAIGRQLEAMTSWGGGSWGLLRSLVLEGPQTVPQLAASRPVARQRIQLIANELAADGLVAFVDNPAHKRSRLVEITEKGRAHYERVEGRLLDFCRDLACGIGTEDLRVTATTLARLKELAASRLEEATE